MSTDFKVTSIEDLVKASQGVLVELPPFAEGQPFIARLKRPSMMALIRANKIPNTLISTANQLFAKGTFSTKDETSISNLFEVLDVVCEACFVEPTYQQIKDAGIELTDDQLIFVFNYTQKGVTALESFRSQLPHSGTDQNVAAVQ